MSEQRNIDSNATDSVTKFGTAGKKAGRKVGKAGWKLAKLAVGGVRRGVLIMVAAFACILVLLTLALLSFFLDFEIRGANLEYARGARHINEAMSEETGGRSQVVNMSEENRLVNNYYKLMSLRSFYKVIDGKPITLVNNPDKFSSVYDYYNRENLYFLSHNFLISADEQMHQFEFRYPEQFILPVRYDKDSMTLLHLTDEAGNLVAESKEYGEDGLSTGNVTKGVWDYGFAPVITYKEYTRYEIIKGSFTQREVCSAIGGVRIEPASGDYSIEIPKSRKTIHVIDQVVSASGEVSYNYQEESLYYKPLLDGKTDNPNEPFTWVKYGECPGHEVPVIKNGERTTEIIDHGSLYMYRGDGAVYETLPVDVGADTNLYGDRYLKDYIGYYKTYVPETVMEDFGFESRTEEDWELLSRLDALNVFGNYEDPIRASLDVGSLIGSDAYTNALSYLPYFEEYGTMFDVDPAILVAIAAWESEGVHSSKNDIGGFGLMGLEDAGEVLTKIEAVRKDGKKEVMVIKDNSSIADAPANIKAATMLLKSYYDRFHGNILLAIHAYSNGEMPTLQCVHKHVSMSNKTMGGVMADPYETGWMEYRNEFSSGGDPFYVEHVLGYYDGEDNQFDAGSASRSIDEEQDERSLVEKVLSAVGGDIASLFASAADIFANSYEVGTPRVGIENHGTENDLKTIIAMSIAYDNQVSFSEAEDYLNNEDSGDTGFQVGFIHLGNQDYVGYFGGSGEAITAMAALLTGFNDPLADTMTGGYRITSLFSHGQIRTDVKTGRAHNGVDVAMEMGTPLYAAGSGTVIKAGKIDSSAGIGVVIQHDNGVITQYYHMSSTAVQKGMRVERGVMIGRSGNTGRSTGPHLHFGVKIDGKFVDPLAYFFQGLL